MATTYFSKYYNSGGGSYNWMGSSANFYFVDNNNGTVTAYLRIYLYLSANAGSHSFNFDFNGYMFTTSNGYAHWEGTGPGGYYQVLKRFTGGYPQNTSAGWRSSQYLTNSYDNTEGNVNRWPNGLPCGTYAYGASLPSYSFKISVSAGTNMSGAFSVSGAVAPCKLTFDPGLGTVSEEYRIVVQDAAYGELPVPERTGYIFLGWFTDASAGTEVTASTTMGNSNTTIYAHWRPAGFTMYDSQGAAHNSLVTAYDSQGASHSVLISFYDSTGARRDVQ